MQGVFFIGIGFTKLSIYPLIGAMTGFAVFMEASNGAIFSLVPAIHPKFSGVVSGVTGGSGNVGGVIFSFWYFAFSVLIITRLCGLSPSSV
jgi:NNP family nitrate/nitrite transporter-like MFS transporter